KQQLEELEREFQQTITPLLKTDLSDLQRDLVSSLLGVDPPRRDHSTGETATKAGRPVIEAKECETTTTEVPGIGRKQSVAQKLLMAVGSTEAPKFSCKRLTNKLNDINRWADRLKAPEDPEVLELYDKLRRAVEDGDRIEVVYDDGNAPEEEPEEAPE